MGEGWHLPGEQVKCKKCLLVKLLLAQGQAVMKMFLSWVNSACPYGNRQTLVTLLAPS